MTSVKRCLLAAAALAAVGAFAAPHAYAGGPCALALPQQLASQHFTIYYDDDPTKPDYMSQLQAGTILATAERAWSSYVNEMGYLAPAVESSGTTEYYVADLSAQKIGAMYCNGAAQLDVTTVVGDTSDYTIASTTFTQIEYRYAPSAFGPEQWLRNGAAAWAAWHALGYPAGATSGLGPYDLSLDCDSAADRGNCAKDGYQNLGDSRWPFYEYLAEKYGNGFIGQIFTASNGISGTTGLGTALAAKGTTLSAEYGNYAAKLLTGGWAATPLNAAAVPVSGTGIKTGATTGAIPTQSFGVNHLATKFVQIDRGDGDGSHACYEATLALTVQIPAGVTSQPTFFWAAAGSAPVALAIAGSTATATIPWDTCNWSTKGYLSLPNTGLVNGTSFVVSGSLTVDFAKPTTSATPPAQTSQFGATVDASSISTVPTLSLFGPQILKLGSDDTKLRLIVRSSGDGSATFSLGSKSLGTVPVRAGGNDIRLALPTSILRTMRRSSSTVVLTMTTFAPDGKTQGATVTRTVQITRPAKKLLGKLHRAK